MSRNHPSSQPHYHEKMSDKEKNHLTKFQEKIVAEISKIMESPEIEETIHKNFRNKLARITHNSETLNALIEVIYNSMKGKLQEIQTRFNNGEISREIATQESKEIIHHNIKLQLMSMQNSLQ